MNEVKEFKVGPNQHLVEEAKMLCCCKTYSKEEKKDLVEKLVTIEKQINDYQDIPFQEAVDYLIEMNQNNKFLNIQISYQMDPDLFMAVNLIKNRIIELYKEIYN